MLRASVANNIASRVVVRPQRDGGPCQFIEAPVVDCVSDSFASVTAWMLENLDRELPVEDLARRSLMSPRAFGSRRAG